MGWFNKMVEYIGLEVMTKTRQSFVFSEFDQALCRVPCVHYHFSPDCQFMPSNSEKTFSATAFIPVFAA